MKMIWSGVVLLLLFVWLLPMILALKISRRSQHVHDQLITRMQQLERQVAQLSQANAPVSASVADVVDPVELDPMFADSVPATDLGPPTLDTHVDEALARPPTPVTSPVTPSAERDPFSAPADWPFTQGNQAQPQTPASAQMPPPIRSTMATTSPIKIRQTTMLEPDEQSLSVVTSVWQSLMQWFTGGNLIVRIGVLVLLVGVVLLLRLANDYLDVPIELRLALVAAGGVALTGLGVYLRERRRGYALSVQGAGLATLYLTLFAAFRLYQLLPSSLTFALLAVLAAISAALAVRQDALPLALLAFGGAFLAPILTSTHSGNVVGLFSYYLLLNVAMAWIAHYRTWKVLNLLGATVTFGLAGFWGWQQFNPALRWPLEGLLLAHLALYVFMAVRYSQQLVAAQSSASLYIYEQTGQQIAPIPVVDSGLLFGVPLLGFGLQAGLLHDLPYALAISSAGLSLLYLLLGKHLLRQGSGMRLLTEGTLALGVGFLALVLPLALDARWTSVGWAVQGAALVWIGQRQMRYWPVLFGLALQVISAALLVWVWFAPQATGQWMGLLVLTVAVWISALFLRPALWHGDGSNPVADPAIDQTVAHRMPMAVSTVVMLVGLLMSVLLLEQSWRQFGLTLWLLQPETLRLAGDVLLIGAISLMALRSLIWPALQMSTRVMWPIVTFFLLATLMAMPYQASGFLLAMLWLASVVLLALWAYALIRLQRVNVFTEMAVNTRVDQALALLSALLLLALLPDTLWPSLQPISPVILPVCVMLWLSYSRVQSAWFDVVQVRRDVVWIVLIPMGLWALAVNASASGQMWGLPYVPVLNPLDITFGLILLFAALAVQRDVVAQMRLPMLLGVGLVVFVSLSSLVVRSLHQWVGTPLWTSGAWSSDSVQTSLTIVWTLMALLLTVLSSRGRLPQGRVVWVAGIGLLSLVVIKLLLVDLSNVAAIARVISFIGAGLIMLVIGYLAPLPPASDESVSDLNQPNDDKNNQ
jgi:uncharacterized membrane protein